jgi:hypothetical protein
MLLAFLMGTRLLSVAEVHLLRLMVGGEGSADPDLLPKGQGWGFRLKTQLGGTPWIVDHPNLQGVLCGLAGLVLVPLTFHLALLLGRFQVWLAEHLLVRA